MASSRRFVLHGGSEISLTILGDAVEITYRGPEAHTVFVALQQPASTTGSAVVPFARDYEGSTVFLPFQATALYFARPGVQFRRSRGPFTWGERAICPELTVEREGDETRMRVPLEAPGQPEAWTTGLREEAEPLPYGRGSISDRKQSPEPAVAVWVKDLRENDGWGHFVGCNDPNVLPGTGDRTIPTYETATEPGVRRLNSAVRPRIYELFVRLFGNTNERRKPNGTLAENGCGKFRDITDAAIRSIADMGFTHIWLMGVVRSATTTDYSDFGIPPTDTDLMKGLAGSPYAIRDCFDVSPDLATDPARRLEEFRALVERVHAHGLKVIVDFVPNHVSRAYRSVVRPELNFGSADDRTQFLARDNNFYWLGPADPGGGPPLRLPTFDPEKNVALSPTCYVLGDCDGRFAEETEYGKVTGDNRVTWAPEITSWYETVKLNYGFDFLDPAQRTRLFPNAASPEEPIPDTWNKMNAVIGHWQQLGVDGFRCDMAHMVPPEFWAWCIGQARRRSAVLFLAEGYDDLLKIRGSDPAIEAVGGRTFVLHLLNAGFDGVYGHPAYETVKAIYDGPAWANDLDQIPDHEFAFHSYVRYAENHDEMRLASPLAWGSAGMDVGRPVSALLFGFSRGPILFYNGQEVGEPAAGEEGFGGDDGRTTLFDYWSMPELAKWVSGHAYDGSRLSPAQRDLREFYGRLISLLGQPAFADGLFLGLNPENINNPEYGRMPGETASGHWIYSYLRAEAGSGQRFLVVINLHPEASMKNVRVRLPSAAPGLLLLTEGADVTLTERLSSAGMTLRYSARTMIAEGVVFDIIPALTPYYFEIT